MDRIVCSATFSSGASISSWCHTHSVASLVRTYVSTEYTWRLRIMTFTMLESSSEVFLLGSFEDSRKRPLDSDAVREHVSFDLSFAALPGRSTPGSIIVHDILDQSAVHPLFSVRGASFGESSPESPYATATGIYTPGNDRILAQVSSSRAFRPRRENPTASDQAYPGRTFGRRDIGPCATGFRALGFWTSSSEGSLLFGGWSVRGNEVFYFKSSCSVRTGM